MAKVALIIIYNHRYERNIDIIEKIYKSRFNNIYHLMPFYDGEKSNVITIYENSHRFEGYVAQGLKSFYLDEFTHYFFIADDLLLNPCITEANYTTHFNLEEDSNFFPGFFNLHNQTDADWWPNAGEAYHYNVRCRGVEIEEELPNYEMALKAFNDYGLDIRTLKHSQIFSKKYFPKQFYNFKKIYKYLEYRIKKIINSNYNLSYPLVGGYSDIFIISRDIIKKFSHYCGAFAASNLFVELAIPTALVLSTKKIITENEMDIKGKALWTKEELSELDKFDNQLKNFIEDFPQDYIYLHPVKLSKLKIEL